MNEQEAIKLMLNEIVCINTADHNECERDCANCNLVKETDELLEAYGMAIQALEKQVAKKPKITSKVEDAEYMKCSGCGLTIVLYGGMRPDYCAKCGQKLDWSDEE